jgi:hypothetical protein
MLFIRKPFYDVALQLPNSCSIVFKGLSTALILEDDLDWDLRLQSQLYDFAMLCRSLTQPITSYWQQRQGYKSNNSACNRQH